MADLATQYPQTPSFESINFKTNTPTQITGTQSGKARRIGFGVSYYSFEIKYPNLTRLEAGTVKGYLAQALGPQFSFEIRLPQLSTSALANQTTQTVRTNAAAAIGAISVPLTNCGANATVLASGDYFVFLNHSKVYQCVSPCTANGSGNATLFFSCPLVKAVPNSTNLQITNVPFTVILAEAEQEFEVGFGGICYSMSIAMREVF